MGAQQVLYGLAKDGWCPCCQQELETTEHVYQCMDAKVVANRPKLLLNLEQKFSQRQESTTTPSTSAGTGFGHSESSGTSVVTVEPSVGKQQSASEVLGMLAFLRQREQVNITRLEVEREHLLPLSAETLGWLQHREVRSKRGRYRRG